MPLLGTLIMIMFSVCSMARCGFGTFTPDNHPLWIDSWDNYCGLFQVVLHGVVNMQLPNQWLWDMVDESVYQFQSFCQYRAKMKSKTEQEISLIKQFNQAWNVYGVLNFLQALVEKSMVIQILEQDKEGLEQFTATNGYDYSCGSNVLKVLGYFSMVGLL